MGIDDSNRFVKSVVDFATERVGTAKRNARERVIRAEMTSLIHKKVAIRATAELKYLRSVVGSKNALLPPS